MFIISEGSLVNGTLNNHDICCKLLSLSVISHSLEFAFLIRPQIKPRIISLSQRWAGTSWENTADSKDVEMFSRRGCLGPFFPTTGWAVKPPIHIMKWNPTEVHGRWDNGHSIKGKTNTDCKHWPAAPDLLTHHPGLHRGSLCRCSRVYTLLGARKATAKSAFPFSPSALIGEEILSVCLGEILVCPWSSRSL